MSKQRTLARRETSRARGRFAAIADAERESAALTDRQRRTLALAYEKGYFDVPRGTSLTDLATTLSVSEQAVSERIRRGLETVLRVTALEDGTADADE